MDCPTQETLLAFVAGALPPAARARIEEHMNTGCQSCDRRLEEVVELRRLSTEALLADVPPWISRRASGIPGGAELAVLFAACVHDTFRDPLPLGVRAAPSDARHMLFSAGEFDLNVRITPVGPGRVRVVGQALAPDDGGDCLPVGGTEVVLAGDGVGMVARPLDDFGAFAFEDLPEGDYELTVAAPSYRFVVPRLAAFSHREDA